MTWAFMAIGKPLAVLEKAKTEFNKTVLHVEPERTIHKKLLDILELALVAMPDNKVVKISIRGWQGGNYEPGQPPGRAITALDLAFTQVDDFVE